jgi:hypothetical protein
MIERNDTIAIIISIVSIVLILIGFGIYRFVQKTKSDGSEDENNGTLQTCEWGKL